MYHCQEICLVLIIVIDTVLDVLGIEAQVPSPSTPERSMWILISRGYERLVNEIHRHHCEQRKKVLRFDSASFESMNLPRETVSMVQKVRILHNRMTNFLVGFEKPKYPRHFATSSKGTNPFVLKPRTYSYTEKEIPREDRILDTIPRWQNCRGLSLETRIIMCVINLVRHR